MRRKKFKNASCGKTFASLGKIKITPCIVAIAPIIQNAKIGNERGVESVAFFRKYVIKNTTQANPMIKSSILI